MCDGMGRSIADHDIIRSLIQAMKREIVQVKRNVVRCSTIQQPSRSSVVAENNMIGSWLPGCGGAISLSALRTRCRGLLISDKPKHWASLGSVSLNTACLTTTQIRFGLALIMRRKRSGKAWLLWSGGWWTPIWTILEGCRIFR